MITTTEGFVTRFHSLTGVTIGERRKNLFLLLNNVNGPAINFAQIQPKTPLEESFKVDVLIRFKRVPELIDVFKTENPILINRVLKVSSWLLVEALAHMDTKTLVDHLFPHISFNCKVKLLNKLAQNLKDAKRGDEIFLAVQKRYGLYLAAKLLPCCSGDLILRHLKTTKIEITERQLDLIIDRNPDLIVEVLDALNQFSSVVGKYSLLFQKVLRNDLNLYLTLIEKYHYLPVRVGRRSTARLIIDSNKASVIGNVDKIYSVLHKRQLLKSVKPYFGEFFFQAFPKSVVKFQLDRCMGFLNFVPSSAEKLKLLTSTYERRYGCSLWEQTGEVLAKILELMAPDEREAWMENHPKPKDIAEDAWTCLMKTDKSLPILKQKFVSANQEERRMELVRCFVDTCHNNRDKSALTDVCEYLAANHKSIDPTIIEAFLLKLKESFPLNKLEEVQWKYVYDLIMSALSRSRMNYLSNYLDDYIRYRLAHDLPAKEQLRQVLKKVPALCSFGYYGRSLKISKEERSYLLLYGELIPELCKDEKRENLYIDFVQSVINFNKQRNVVRIPVASLKDAVDSVLAVIKSERQHYKLNDILPYLIRHLDLDQTWFDTLLDGKNYGFSLQFVEWLLRRYPLKVKEKLDKIIDLTLAFWYTLINDSALLNFRNYSHLEIPQRIIEICVGIVKSTGEESDDGKKRNAVSALAFLMKPEDFVDLVTPYYPTTLIMDANDEANQSTYKLQQAITASLKNANPPSTVLECVSNFSKGDYLKFIQRSLYSVSHSVSESKLVLFFASLIDRPVSVRKHSIYLTLKVLDRTEIQKMLDQLMKTERNSSIRKFLFQGAFRFFCKNPERALWNLVKENAMVIDANDMEAFDTFMEFNKVPIDFRPDYVQFCWKLLERLPNVDDKVSKWKCSLIDFIDGTIISGLSEAFCRELIARHLFVQNKSDRCPLDIDGFIYKYLIYAKSEDILENRIGFLFGELEKHVNQSWNSSETNLRNHLDTFLTQLCMRFVGSDSEAPRSVLVKFSENWNKLLPPSEAFDHYLNLNFALILADPALSAAQTAEALVKLCDDSCSPDPILVHTFSQVSEMYMDRVLEGDAEKQYDFIRDVLKGGSPSKCRVLYAISLLPLHKSEFPKLVSAHNEILLGLGKIADPTVKLSLDGYYEQVANLRGAQETEIDLERKWNNLKSAKKKTSSGFHFAPRYDSGSSNESEEESAGDNEDAP